MACQTMVLFNNDAVEIRYSDGSRLQVSPCGASFTFWKSSPRIHGNQAPMLLSNQRIQQRTRYAVSDYRTRVLQALEFRNQFAVCPYLCRDIVDQHCLLHIYSDIQDVSWPSSHTDADVKRLPDGDIQVTSIDQCATLKLSNTRQQFSVEFLCKVPKEGNNTKSYQSVSGLQSKVLPHELQQASLHAKMLQSEETSRTNDSSHMVSNLPTADHDVNYLSNNAQNSGMSSQNNPTNTGKTQISNELSHSAIAGGCEYVWVVQHYSVDGCPPCWRHPLQLALRIPSMKMGAGPDKDCSSSLDKGKDKQQNTTPIREKQTSVKNTSGVINTALPSALPVNCPASHLHSWNDSKILLQGAQQDTAALEMEYAVNGGIKVLMVGGLLYRLLGFLGSPSIEIYPGDNSVIKSCHPPGGIACDVFFTHYTSAPDGSMEEKMYSTCNLPPDKPGCRFSLATILARASRLLQMHATSQATTSLPCWKVIQQSNNIPQNSICAVLLEEKDIPGVGRFSAYSDGYVRIVYSDRTVLDWRCDLSQCIMRYWLKNKEDIYKESNPSHEANPSSSDTCRLLLPNGQYVMVNVKQPALEYHRYIAVAEEWRTWVNLLPNERAEFYQQQYINDPHRAVHEELKKIQNFTYITETLPTYLPTCDITDTSKVDKHHCSSSEHRQETSDNHGATISHQDVTTTSGVSLEAIKEALSRTSQAISSIETLLE